MRINLGKLSIPLNCLGRDQARLHDDLPTPVQHVKKLSLSDLSRRGAIALEVGSKDGDKLHSAIVKLAANAIQDGSLKILSAEHEEVIYNVYLKDEDFNNPGELQVRAKQNDQMRYDILELKHKSYASGPVETVTLTQGTDESKKKSAAPALLTSPLTIGITKQPLPKLSDYSLEQIKKRDDQFVARKLNKLEIRELYQKLDDENLKLPLDERKTENELWDKAIGTAGYTDRSSFSARNRMSLRAGKNPTQAMAMAAVSLTYTPIGMAVKALTPEHVRCRRELEARRQLDAQPSAGTDRIRASRPEQVHISPLNPSRTPHQGIDESSDISGFTTPQQIMGSGDTSMAKSGDEISQSVLPEMRARLDAILELLDNESESNPGNAAISQRPASPKTNDQFSTISYIDADGGV